MALLVCLVGAATFYVGASRRILFWDWSFYWSMTDMSADLVRHAQWQTFLSNVALKVGDEYSLVPSVLPSLLMALFRGGSLLRYVVSVTVCYAAPALLAVGALGFALACTLTPAMDQVPRHERLGLITLGAFAALLLLPHFFQVVLRFKYVGCWRCGAARGARIRLATYAADAARASLCGCCPPDLAGPRSSSNRDDTLGAKLLVPAVVLI